MGQTKPFRAIALIVEDDPSQREMISLLLEESHYDVIQCESAEAAGSMNGVELAFIAKESQPKLDVVVTSGRPLAGPLPDGAKFWPKPWAPLDILREAEIAQAVPRAAPG